jgi:hypothetical protein
MSKLEVDQVDPQSGTTLTLGTSGDTVSIPSGVTLANSGTVTGIPASAIDSGTIATARLGTGTASSSTFLRGDQTYAAAGLSGWSEDGANNNLLPASASAGIYLGVSSATAANLLDDYEEGTWTPAITGATGVTNLEGSYTKVGNLVTVWVYMLNGNIGGSPTYEMTGLPFTVDATRSTTSSVASYNTFGSNATSVLGLISITTTVIDFIYNVNNSAWLTQNIQTSANAYLSFSASYIAN